MFKPLTAIFAAALICCLFSGGATAAGTQKAPQARADKSLGKLTMMQAVKRALRNHPQTKGAMMALVAAMQNRRKAMGRYYPRVDLRSVYGYEYSDNPTTRSREGGGWSAMRQEMEGTVTQLIFDGFGVPRLVQERGLLALAESHKAADVREVLGLRVIEAYLDVLLIREQVALARANVASKTKYADQVNMRLQGQVGAVSDLEEAKGRLAAAHSALVEQKRDLKIALATLEEAKGGGLGDPDPAQQAAPKVPGSVVLAVKQAIKDHPALKRRQAEVAAADAAVRGHNSHWWPRLELIVGGSSNRNVDGAEGSDADVRALLNMNINLYGGGMDAAERRRLIAIKRENQQGLKALKLVVIKNVKTAWAEMEAAESDLSFRARVVESNRKVVAAFDEQFAMGRRTLLDLLNLDDALYRSRAAHLEGKYNVILNRYRLLAAQGNLLDKIGYRDKEFPYPITMAVK